MPEPTVSVIIVTRNSLAYLPGCFESLEAQTLRPAEVVVVDNGSTDGSAAWVRECAPTARLLCHDTNHGFCAANNLGIAESTGEFVFLLNADIELESEYLRAVVTAIASDPANGWGAGKLLRLDSRRRPVRVIDSAGEVVTRSRRMVNRGDQEVDEGQFDAREEIFGVTAAAAIYRRSMLEDIRLGDQFFDEDYFAYLEDCDLNWRARLRDWRCVYDPTAVAFHARHHGRRLPVLFRRHAFANRYISILKNETAWNLVLALPHLVAYDSLLLLRTLVREPAVLLGFGKVLRLLPRVLRMRRAIQRSRKATSRSLREWMRPEGWGERVASFLRTGKPWRRVTFERRPSNEARGEAEHDAGEVATDRSTSPDRTIEHSR